MGVREGSEFAGSVNCASLTEDVDGDADVQGLPHSVGGVDRGIQNHSQSEAGAIAERKAATLSLQDEITGDFGLLGGIGLDLGDKR